MDPVLKRAQFNQKIVNLTQQQEESSRAKMGIKRQVSAETRLVTSSLHLLDMGVYAQKLLFCAKREESE